MTILTYFLVSIVYFSYPIKPTFTETPMLSESACMHGVAAEVKRLRELYVHIPNTAVKTFAVFCIQKTEPVT